MKKLLVLVAILLAATGAFADQDLKANTSATLLVGPFLDDTDGKTPETALSITQADVRLSKNSAAFAQKNNSSACTHAENGYYFCSINTTDTNTPGRLQVNVNKTGALPVFQQYNVVTEVDYVEKYERDSAKVYGSITTTVTPSTTSFSTSLTESTNDHYNGGLIKFLSGTLKGQLSNISDYVGTNGQITVSPNLTESPSNGDTFVIY